MNYSGYLVDKDNNKYYTGIVESGSNSNGNYIKFSDGTMICHNVGIYIEKEINKYTFNFPIAFKNVPTVLLTNRYSYAKNITWSIGNVKETSVDLYPLQNNSTPNVIVSTSLIAIGKWR